MHKTKLTVCFVIISFGFFGMAGVANASVCEAMGTATCYYIDPQNGSDNNPGTYVSPWASFKNIISYYQSSYRPSGWVNINPGDYIYLMDGVLGVVVTPGNGSGASGGNSYIAYFRTEKGTATDWYHIKAYPGASPIIDPQYQGNGIRILQSSYWDISGIIIRNVYSSGESGGLSIPETNHIKVHEVEIYNTDGVDNNNLAGFHAAGTSDTEIYNSIFHDNYDRTNADTGGQATENSSNMVFFGGGNISIHDNLFYQTPSITDPKSGTCLKYKHASSDPNAYFNVYNNTFKNCKISTFGTGTANTNFHHNVIIGGEGSIISKDHGGPTHQTNQIFEYNTIYNQRGFYLNPTVTWRNASFPDDPKNIIFRNNIVYDTQANYGQERALIDIGAYMSDATYNIIAPQLTFSANCYYNPNRAPQFNMGASNGGASSNYSVLGKQYTLAEWQALGYDTDSIITDPQFVNAAGEDFHLLAGSPCANMGAYAGIIVTDTTPPAAPQGLVVN